MQNRASFFLAAVLLSSLAGHAAAATWFRAPAISPDGETVVFTARGDLWQVPIEGGVAVALTSGDSWEGHPVFSRDGKKLAYASDRFGDLDVFVLDLEEAATTRLSFHDSADIPLDFSADGIAVLFSSARIDSVTSSFFPTGALPELYEVKLAGGPPRMVSTVPASDARWSPDGSKIAYVEEKAYENEWRQRDTSAFARDIWIYDTGTGEHTKVTSNPAGDHYPRWSPDGSALFMQSEIDGNSFNVRRLDLASGDSTVLTGHQIYPARGLSVSDDGVLVYSFHGELYRAQAGQQPARIEITLPTARLVNAPQPVPATAQVSEFAVSADGSEVAFISRGEIFVTDTQFGDTVRITNTPQQERSVSFAPDGRALIYAAERGQSWAIYESVLTDPNEPRFSAATTWDERQIYAAAGTDAFQPKVSPDGKMVAFLENRDAIRVVNRDGGKVRTVFPADLNYSYSDGDISFAWSPDSRWIAADYIARGFYFYGEIGIAPADGSKPPQDISINGYADSTPVWHPDGGVVYWFSDRYGNRSHGSWGSEFDVVAGFVTEDAWTRFNLSKQERALLEEHGKSDDGEDNGDEKDKKESEDNENEVDVYAYLGLSAPPKTDENGGEPGPIEVDFDAVEDRTRRLTLHSSDLAGAVLSKDLSTLYYLAAFEGGYDLWSHDLHEEETKKMASLDADAASLAISGDGKKLFLLADGKLMQAEIGDKIEPKPIEAGGELVLRADAEREYLFDHVWRQVKDKFYDPDFHGVDWDAMRAAYRPKVAAVSHNRDFAVLVSEMLGMLNASHTGMYYRGGNGNGDDRTGALGAIFELDGSAGLAIAEVLADGPLDREIFDVKAGDRIVAINGTVLDATTNPFEHLNRKAGAKIRLTLAREGREQDQIIRVRTYSRDEQARALYERWIERRRAIVEERSEGRIGYLHIRSMNDAGFRQTFSELFGRNFDKEAVIVDTRFNGGGWLHDDLLTLFSGEPYFTVRVRGRTFKGAPEERWTKPSAVVMNEGNYSNSHMFPYAYGKFGLGPLVGMPVPGTATAVWWENVMSGDLVFGIPQVGILDDDNLPLENQQLEPDVKVDNPPADAATGVDRPVEKAVDTLLTTLDQA